jgi:phosphodiesterase/alkaline phosphatase D-like protein
VFPLLIIAAAIEMARIVFEGYSSIEFFFDRWDGFCYRRNHKYKQSIQLVRELERKGCKS